MITILGPTASGKTLLAATLAKELDAEVISADSRQVYRRMDIGTGKDLSDYIVEGSCIPYHLIDIVEPGLKYNVFEYQQDFFKAYHDVVSRGKFPILCGGTGLYLESVLRGYDLKPVPENPLLREKLSNKNLEELTDILKTYKTLHNTTDVDTVKRAIRAIEIEEFYINNTEQHNTHPSLQSLVVGIDIERECRRKKITERLHQRLDDGMVNEVKSLLDEGIAPDDLIYYGLEYKYLTMYIIGKLSYDEMVHKLEVAIHQFAKRQMTWFRGMERRGIKIHWIKSSVPIEDKLETIKDLMKE